MALASVRFNTAKKLIGPHIYSFYALYTIYRLQTHDTRREMADRGQIDDKSGHLNRLKKLDKILMF